MPQFRYISAMTVATALIFIADSAMLSSGMQNEEAVSGLVS